MASFYGFITVDKINFEHLFCCLGLYQSEGRTAMPLTCMTGQRGFLWTTLLRLYLSPQICGTWTDDDSRAFSFALVCLYSKKSAAVLMSRARYNASAAAAAA